MFVVEIFSLLRLTDSPALQCSASSHRCQHAATAYTGPPSSLHVGPLTSLSSSLTSSSTSSSPGVARVRSAGRPGPRLSLYHPQDKLTVNIANRKLGKVTAKLITSKSYFGHFRTFHSMLTILRRGCWTLRRNTTSVSASLLILTTATTTVERAEYKHCKLERKLSERIKYIYLRDQIYSFYLKQRAPEYLSKFVYS